MKILHLIKTSEGATWALRLMEQLRSQYADIIFSVIIPAGGKHFEEYKTICEHVYEFDFSINSKLISHGKVFKAIVVRDNPDIIHSWFTQTTLYARLFLRKVKIPRIFQVVGPAHLENPIFRFGDTKSAQKYDYWIATSKYIYDKYKNTGILEERLFLNYAFIDTQSLLEAKNNVPKRDFRKEFGIDENVNIVGTASYIYPPKFYEKEGIKGHEKLLGAFEGLLKERNDVVLIIAGTTFGSNDSYERKLKKMAAQISTDKIFFTGRFKHIYEVISNFDVFVYLSKSENLGGVYESLLFEIPTISSNRGALPELVINNETGYNVNPEVKTVLKEKINELLDNDYPLQRKNGKELVLNIFDKNKMVEKAYKIYCEVLRNL